MIFVLALLLVVLGFVLGFLVAEGRNRPRLNLTVKGAKTVNIGQTATATIAPTAAGVPAPVTGVVYDAAPGGIFTIVPAADGLSAVYTAVALGIAMAVVTAVNSAGVTLSEKAALPEVVPVAPAADALNLKVTTP